MPKPTKKKREEEHIERINKLIQEMKEEVAFLRGFNDGINDTFNSPYNRFILNHA